MPHDAAHPAVNIKPYPPTSPWLFFSTESTYRLHLSLPQGKVEDHSTWFTASCFGDQAKTLLRVLLMALGQCLTVPAFWSFLTMSTWQWNRKNCLQPFIIDRFICYWHSLEFGNKGKIGNQRTNLHHSLNSTYVFCIFTFTLKPGQRKLWQITIIIIVIMQGWKSCLEDNCQFFLCEMYKKS